MVKYESRIESNLNKAPLIVEEYYREVLLNKKNVSTADKYISDICCFFKKHSDLNTSFYLSITSGELSEYLAQLQLGASATASAWSSLNSFFAYLEDKDYIHRNPMKKVPRATQTQDNQDCNLTCTEILSFIDTISSSRKSKKKRDLAIVLLIATCGLKIGTIHQIDLACYSQSAGVLIIDKKEIKLPLKAKRAIEDWLIQRNADSKNADESAMFISTKHNRISKDAIAGITHSYNATIEKSFSFEDIRRGIARGLFNIGISIEYISNYLQHDNAGSTYSFLEKLHGQEKNPEIEDKVALLKIFGYSSVEVFEKGEAEAVEPDLLEKSEYLAGTKVRWKLKREDIWDMSGYSWFSKEKIDLFCKMQTMSNAIIWLPFDCFEKSGFYLSPLFLCPEYDYNEIEDRHVYLAPFDLREYAKSDWQDENSIGGEKFYFFLYVTGKLHGEAVSILRIFEKDAGISNTVYVFNTSLCSEKQENMYFERIESNIQFFEELASTYNSQHAEKNVADKLYDYTSAKFKLFDLLCSFKETEKVEENFKIRYRRYRIMQKAATKFVLACINSELNKLLE